MKSEFRKVKTEMTLHNQHSREISLFFNLRGLGWRNSEFRMMKSEIREPAGWSNLFHSSDFTFHFLLWGLGYGG